MHFALTLTLTRTTTAYLLRRLTLILQTTPADNYAAASHRRRSRHEDPWTSRATPTRRCTRLPCRAVSGLYAVSALRTNLGTVKRLNRASPIICWPARGRRARHAAQACRQGAHALEHLSDASWGCSEQRSLRLTTVGKKSSKQYMYGWIRFDGRKTSSTWQAQARTPQSHVS